MLSGTVSADVCHSPDGGAFGSGHRFCFAKAMAAQLYLVIACRVNRSRVAHGRAGTARAELRLDSSQGRWKCRHGDRTQGDRRVDFNGDSGDGLWRDHTGATGRTGKRRSGIRAASLRLIGGQCGRLFGDDFRPPSLFGLWSDRHCRGGSGRFERAGLCRPALEGLAGGGGFGRRRRRITPVPMGRAVALHRV